MDGAAAFDPSSTMQRAWQEVCDRARREIAEGQPIRGLARLATWPDLADVPEHLVEVVTRVCALLWSKPAATYLIARAIEAEPHRTAVVVRALQLFGHIDIIVDGADKTAALPAPGLRAAAVVAPQRERASLIGKLWRRVMG